MNVTGLFAGIGGIEKGFAAAGHECNLLCESWEPARAVLSSRFPETIVHDDVVSLPSLPSDTEILAAGFPCQDLSQAGLTKGIAGSKSSLVSHVFRLIDAQPVPLVMLENVSFMLQLNGGAAMRALVAAFEERGYRWAYRVVNSIGYLPQRRERVFLVASRSDVAPEDVLLADDVDAPKTETTLETHAHGFYWTEGNRGLGWAPDAVPTLKNGSTVGIPSPPAVLLPCGNVVKPDIRDAERLQGFPEDWTLPAEAVARASCRWSLVGNAVSVPVAAWLGQRFAEPGQYDLSRDAGWTGENKWPRAARSREGPPVAVTIGGLPAYKSRPALHQFLRYEGTPLSARATNGFLKRAEASSLRFVPGFLDRLKIHLARVEGTGDCRAKSRKDLALADTLGAV